jgi:voltage-gated potassium channel
MQQTFDRHIYRYLLGLAVFTIALGTVVYHFVEHLSWLNSYYFSVITLATVGYGDITPKTDAGKLFTTFYVFVGVGIITTFISYNLRRRATKIQARHDSRESKKAEKNIANND